MFVSLVHAAIDYDTKNQPKISTPAPLPYSESQDDTSSNLGNETWTRTHPGSWLQLACRLTNLPRLRNQPIWEIWVKLDHFPKYRVEHKKSPKPPPRRPWFINLLWNTECHFFWREFKEESEELKHVSVGRCPPCYPSIKAHQPWYPARVIHLTCHKIAKSTNIGRIWVYELSKQRENGQATLHQPRWLTSLWLLANHSKHMCHN